MQGNIYPVTGRGGEQVFPITSDKAIVISGEENKRLSEKWEDFYSKEEVNQLIPNPNLLDNSDFMNPINQRGKSEYTNGYTIDRWKLAIDGPKFTVVSGVGIKLSEPNATYGAPLVQLFESGIIDENEVYTFSVCDIDGVVEIVSGKFIDNAEKITSWGMVRLTKYSEGPAVQISVAYGNTHTFRWAKLEKGSIATPWQPKDYGTELMECMRYFYKSDGDGMENEQIIFSQYNGAIHIKEIFPVQMRTTPTILVNGTFSENKTGAEKKSFNKIELRGRTGKGFSGYTSTRVANSSFIVTYSFSADADL